MSSIACCSVCLDDDEPVIFKCSKLSCSYQLCASCIREAFKDSSGSNSSVCQLCQTPSDMDMITALCGIGAVKAVEQKVTSSIKFELREEMYQRERAKKEVSEINARAREIFNTISDEINLRCPRCKVVFHDYDGCNALSCAVSTCKAAFCAICLKDCGKDAHPHVLKEHGNYFDKKLFYEEKLLRTKRIINGVMEELKQRNDPFELIQLVQNHIDQAKLSDGANDGTHRETQYKVSNFVNKARENLIQAVRDDRNSVLSNPETHQRSNQRYTEYDVSPRCAIPDFLRLTMRYKGENVYQLKLEYNSIDDIWETLNIEKIAKELEGRPRVDVVANITQSIKSATLVLCDHGHVRVYQSQQQRPPKDHTLAYDEVCISLKSVDKTGSLGTDEPLDHHGHLEVLGLNPNLRMMMLEKHILNCEREDLVSTPLEHLLGHGKPLPVLNEIHRPVPKSQYNLNEEQVKVAHPLMLKSAMEVAGPPGTGKTKTIVELVRALLKTTDLNIVILSERNGAINAIAEKFQEAALEVENSKTSSEHQGNRQEQIRQKIKTDLPKIEITDEVVWLSLLTFGSIEAMGDSAKLFLLEEKMKYHPELLRLRKKVETLKECSSSHVEAMRLKIANEIDDFGDKFNIHSAYDKSDLIMKNEDDLGTPLTTLNYVSNTVDNLRSVLVDNGGKITEEEVADMVCDCSVLLGRIIEVRIDKEKKQPGAKSWNEKYTKSLLIDLLKRFQRILDLELFDEVKALAMNTKLTNAKNDLSAQETEVEKKLVKDARLQMSTIGSSHKLPVHKKCSMDVEERLRNLSLNDSDDDSYDEEPVKETVVIFDEAGCIPSYELLGISRLGLDIKALLLVGDKHQLPPYNPTRIAPRANQRDFLRRQTRNTESHSLLDASALNVDDGKVLLTTQYRVPKDIADLLNSRIYGGNYNTCHTANVPRSGINVIDVKEDSRKKYVNYNEIDEGLDLVNNLISRNRCNILIITPYKNQQREFEHKIKARDMSNYQIPVLTIDQCQGQEADIVILSLVQKPTRFLTKNRLNVALSRTRKRLYILVDKEKLRFACSNRDWESAPLAADLLRY